MTDLQPVIAHSADEALDKFKLIQGRGDGETTACLMSAVSWMAGEAFTDSPKCAHSTLTSMAIRANDAEGTTPEQRADILRFGALGLVDTWWIPSVVIAGAIATPKPPEGEEQTAETAVDQLVRTLANITAWKALRTVPDLRSANLGYADLRSANLGYADLGYANLGSADLGSADLRSANLRSANLGSANLRSANLGYADLRSADLGSADLGYANLRSANLGYADLRSANLGSADLRSANLGSANLGSANLRSANLGYADLRSANLGSALNVSGALNLDTAYGNKWTVVPDGWKVDESSGLICRVSEVES